MADLMTFPDTVEEFMESYKMVDTDHVYSNGTEYVPIFRMRQWFEHKPERKRGEWIPCSERLPDTPDMVLVTIDWGDGDYEVSTDEYWSIDGVETGGWGNLHGEVVTAWMPLPEPYGGEKDG